MPISGCLQNTQTIPEPTSIIEIEGVFVTGPDGLPVDSQPLDLIFNLSDVGEDGAEPSIGVTSSGCIFFIAFEKVMRSCDYGDTWENVAGPMCAFQTNDPVSYTHLTLPTMELV